MANICNCTFCIFGNKEMLNKFYEDARRASSFDLEDDQTIGLCKENPNWVGNLYLIAGFKEEELNNLYSRGEITGLRIEPREGCVYLFESMAWQPNEEEIEEMLEKFYPGLEMVFSCEEPGFEIYVNTDKTGEHLNYRYLLDYYCDWDELPSEKYEQYKTEDEVLRAISGISGLTISLVKVKTKVRPVEDVNWTDWLREIKNVPENKDCFLAVHKYKTGVARLKHMK